MLMAAGGTGGHLFPALAIARALQAKRKGAEIAFVGTERGMEVDWGKSLGFPTYRIRIRGLKGKGGIRLIGSLALIPQALSHSWAILSQFRPHVTVGVGGYVSGPLLLLSAMRGIPTLIHEQNAFPGFTNRILAPVVTRIAYSFPGSEGHFRGRRSKLIFTGNPIRREIAQGEREKAGSQFDLDPRRFTLLCFGGSQGASRINMALLSAAPRLVTWGESIQLLHATGEKDYQGMAEGAAGYPFRARVLPFIHDMASAYALADFVIARAGASTIAELAAVGKPSLLVPYPYATNDHQRYNAEVLAHLGGAWIIPDKDLDGISLSRIIREAYQNPQDLALMGQRARSLARIDADDRIADLILHLFDNAPGGAGKLNES